MRFVTECVDSVAQSKGPYFLNNPGREMFLNAGSEAAPLAPLSDELESPSDGDGVTSAGSGAYMVVWEPNLDGTREVKIIPTIG
jgi:hypothetical protein